MKNTDYENEKGIIVTLTKQERLNSGKGFSDRLQTCIHKNYLII